jgi:hypothetical protein
MTRTTVQTVNSELLALPMVQAMQDATPQQVGAMKRRIADAVEERRQHEIADGQPLSKDFAHLVAWCTSDALARLFIAEKIDPRGYLLQGWMDDAEMRKRGFDPVSRTVNLKAYKKVLELANYVVSGQSKLEAVFKTYTACSILASRFTQVLTRETCERFLSNIDLTYMSADLADAVSSYQAKHMSFGASTQTSQMQVTLASLGCGYQVRDGRTKHFVINPQSQIMQALAIRFGMTDQLAAIPVREIVES